MSTQGATLRRGTVHIPIWPAAVVVLAATAVVIGLSTLGTDTIAPARPVTVVTDAERLASSSAAIREQGAVAPVVVGISHVTPKATCPSATWGSRTRGRTLPPARLPHGLENPAAYPPSEAAPAVDRPRHGGSW